MTHSDQVPCVAGVLTSAQVAQTAASIVAMQEGDGAVPWTVAVMVGGWAAYTSSPITWSPMRTSAWMRAPVVA